MRSLQVAELDERRQPALPRHVQLAAVLAQLGRDEGVAEIRIEVRLVGERVDFTRLGDRDAVLGNRGSRRTASSRRATLWSFEPVVLEQRSVALRRDDAEVDAKPLGGDDRRLGIAVRDDLVHGREADQVRRQRRRVRRGSDEVEVSKRLPTAPDAASLRDAIGGRVGAELLDELAHDGSPAPSSPRSGWRSPMPSSSARRIFSSVFAPSPVSVRSRSSAAVRSSASVVIPSSFQIRAAVLGPRPGAA